MTRSAVAFALALTTAMPAGAQTALSTAGDVGSAATHNGFPASGGAVALPSPATAAAGTSVSAAATTAPAAGAGTSATGSRAGGARGGGTGTGSASSGLAASSKGGSANWVLCPPSGAPGLAPLFAGTDLSCAPD